MSGFLHRIELENFKSYGGRQTIGPFTQFTCVIGPNGAGKSNLMDAISFVMGVQSAKLRSKRLRDLVFRVEGETVDRRRKASVTAIYRVGDDDEIDGFSSGDEIRFERRISPTGTGSYRLNGRECTWDEYDGQLQDIHILVKARNFLVFQGDVESIAQKGAKELTSLFEQISGSEEFREEYEELRAKKEQAEENTIFNFQRKKGLMNERKEVKSEKEEAERFGEKGRDHARKKTEMYLFQLYHVHRDMAQHQDSVEKFAEELADIQHREHTVTEQLKEKKRAQAKQSRSVDKCKKAVDRRREAHDELEPRAIKQREQQKHLGRRLTQDRKALAKIQADCEGQEAEIKGLEDDIAEVAAAEEGLESTEAQRDGPLQKTDEQVEEYQRLKEQCREGQSQLRGELQSFQRQQAADGKRLDQFKRESEDMQQRRQRYETESEQLDGRVQAMGEAAAGARAEVEELERELTAVAKVQEEDAAKLQEVDDELGEVARQLSDARDDRRQSKHEKKQAQNLESLMRLFSGVRGRLVDLCKPTQRRYNMAVTVACGVDMDSIVVDEYKTACECVQYLREHRLGTFTFIPLDTIRSKEISPRLRSLTEADSLLRFAIDVIDCDADIMPALQYAVKDAVVCETLDAARDLCFRQNVKVKAVTLGGAVISKAGTMTGGNTSDARRNAGRWDEREFANLKRRREELQQEHAELTRKLPRSAGRGGGGGGGRRGSSASSSASVRQQELNTQIAGLRNRERYSLADRTNTEKKLKECSQQLKRTKEQLRTLRPELQQLEAAIEERQQSIDRLEKKFNKEEDKVFAQFSRSVGVANIREYEAKQLEEAKTNAETRRRLAEQKQKLTAQLTYERSRDLQRPLRKLEKRIAANEAKAEEIEEGKLELKQQEEEAMDKLEEAKATHRTSVAALKDRENELKAVQVERQACLNEKGEVIKSQTTHETQVERLRGRLHEVLQKAKVEEVELPMVAGDDEDDEDGTGSGSGSDAMDLDAAAGGSQSQQTSQSESDSQLSGSGRGSSTEGSHFSQSDSRAVRRDRVTANKVDFSALKRNRRVDSQREFEEILSEYENDLEALDTELERMQPNMKAAEKYAAVSEKFKTQAQDLEDAKQEAQEISERFTAVKQKRHTAFMRAYEHVSSELNRIYKDLTQSSKHPLGGSAYLTLDDTLEEPYNAGMKFNAMPPMKRFRDMEQLSGGEKSVAALALLFAIHSYQQPPFFVMDEIDAAMDNVNVKKVCNYIRSRSQDFQLIVISLKDMFYERANSLVGICRDATEQSSRTMTLDLEQYDVN